MKISSNKPIKSGQTPRKSPAPKKAVVAKNFNERADEFLTGKMDLLGWFFVGLAALFSLLLFDPNISVAGDDSAYIIRAADFIHKFEYPSYQGPLYPMLLGLVIGIAGLNLTILKGLSLVCMLAFIYMIFKAFQNRISPFLLLVVIMVLSINSFVLHFASQTFSEAMFMFLMAWMVLVMFRYFIDKQESTDIKIRIKRHLFLALLLLALFLTRSVGLTAFFATSAFFLLTRRWSDLFIGAVTFASLFLLFHGLKWLLWQDTGLSFGTQGASLLLKDAYNPAMGKEDLAGFFQRFIENSDLYLSRHFYNMIGLRKFESVQTMLPLLTLVFYLLFLTGLVLSWLKNKYLFFTGLLALIFFSVTFIILQTNWDQDRLIIPAFPYMLFSFLAPFSLLATWKSLRPLYWMLPVAGLIMFTQLFPHSVATSREIREKSGKFDGYSPDWKHYLQISEWAAKNIPDTAVIACRKPSMSYIYGNGREFFPISKVPVFSVDLFFNNWAKDSIPYDIFTRKELARTPMEPSVVYQIKASFVAQIVTDTNAYLFYRFPDSSRKTILADMRKVKLKSMNSRDSIRKLVTSGVKPPVLVYPDSLLIPLMKANVSYVIQANLRQYAHRKDGNIINTVERYMSLIADKYDDFMQLVHKIGEDDDEPAAIFKLNYEKQKELLKKK